MAAAMAAECVVLVVVRTVVVVCVVVCEQHLVCELGGQVSEARVECTFLANDAAYLTLSRAVTQLRRSEIVTPGWGLLFVLCVVFLMKKWVSAEHSPCILRASASLENRPIRSPLGDFEGQTSGGARMPARRGADGGARALGGGGTARCTAMDGADAVRSGLADPHDF